MLCFLLNTTAKVGRKEVLPRRSSRNQDCRAALSALSVAMGISRVSEEAFLLVLPLEHLALLNIALRKPHSSCADIA